MKAKRPIRLWLTALLSPLFFLDSAIALELKQPLHVITVCSDKTYVDGMLFNETTMADESMALPAAVRELDPRAFRNPAFRSIPSPHGFIVIEESGGTLHGRASFRKNGVEIEMAFRPGNDGQLKWDRLSGRTLEGEFLGLFADGFFLRPASDLTTSPLVKPTLDKVLREGDSLRLQDRDSRDYVIFDTAKISRAYESSRLLCEG
ncbi:hypothetical protein [Natronospira bacteriovora]|uniref:Uncharacterized protein n=1 Tax=Natronospira bacteriovora TaxID=3069753 RepID=A0ABU0W9H9_9GAMM|nr:hypothetical protein [Natronospira sp. AB-CW4]MDQ2070683.1 hypothetical protein [Natronospira sp. AB-CW4]